MAGARKMDEEDIRKALTAFGLIGLGLVLTGLLQSWNAALGVLNLCLISGVMALGLNIQWGYAGLFNAGVMAFTAVGGMTAVLVSYPPVTEAWQVGAGGLLASVLALAVTAIVTSLVYRRLPAGRKRFWLVTLVAVLGYLVVRSLFGEAVQQIEAVNPARTGFLGGLGLPIVLSWLAGGLVAAALAWFIGRISLGLRADYLAIATLGIAEIVISILKNEDWLVRGVKNVTGLPRPVPYEVELQQSDWFASLVSWIYSGRLENAADQRALLAELLIPASSIFVKLCYTGLFAAVTLVLLLLANRVAQAPWGRMMRAIRDNEAAAAAMGKDVVARHRQAFIVGSAVIGLAGAMLTTLDGQFTPGGYNPLRYTFLVWVMVIVGGSGHNLGAILGGFIIWFVWVEAEPVSLFVMRRITDLIPMEPATAYHLMASAPHMRLFVMGLVLLLVLRYSPRGVLAEK